MRFSLNDAFHHVPKQREILADYIDNRVLQAFRERADAAGRGYQTMINEALREHLDRSEARVDAETIRRARLDARQEDR